ncbi:MAG: saccharopine dehydrogenase C-terminal domain-containing protein [Parachlamydiaceae bacterium]
MKEFRGKVVFLGCGSVAQCSLAMIGSVLKISPKQISIIDFVDNRSKVADVIAQGASYFIEKVTKDNYATILEKHLSPGDLLIDLAWNIETLALMGWCHEHDVCFVNTSVELWEPYADVRNKHPRELTLYHRQMQLRDMVKGWKKKNAPTAIVDHGVNPGLVSHFTKRALLEIAQEIVLKKPNDPRVPALTKAIADKDFAQLAYLSGVKVIHISERDTQITSKPKRVNEFVNTWSVEGLIEEGIAPAEAGWGTHERSIPKGSFFHLDGPKNQIGLAQKGVKARVQSWVPSGPIIGMVIRHGEAFSISDSLTVWKGDEAQYRPTVHYAYCPSDSAICSIHELEMRNFVPQKHQRILSNEIIDGKEELGCLLMGHDFGAWWIGSILDIEASRKLVPGQNATTVQVAAGVLSAAAYAINHPHLGFCLPDDLDYEEVLAVAMPYLGNFLSIPSKWSPLDNVNDHVDYGSDVRCLSDPWQFSNFLVSSIEFEPLNNRE